MSDVSPLIVKYIGGRTDDNKSTIAVSLRDSDGHDGVLHFTPEAAKSLAFDILSLIGVLEEIQEGGVKQDCEVGQKIHSTAIPISAFRVDWIENPAGEMTKVHAHFYAKSKAHFPLSLEPELVHQLRKYLTPKS